MSPLYAVFLGILQGITEFLPISSSAHLILAPLVTGQLDQGLAFDLAVHVGTLLAVVLYFRRDVIQLTTDVLLSARYRRTVGQSPLAWCLVLATLPACLAGALLLDAIENNLRSVAVIFITTLLFGILLGFADVTAKARRKLSEFTLTDALLIGLAQAVSLIPGTSRSGATMTAGLLLGYTREAASRFSFLMAIPITALAAGVKLLDIISTDAASIDWLIFAIGAGTSFITALAAIHFFLAWLNRFGMWPYVIYRLVLALLIYWFLLR
ncbi:undecaprenyl-diphosphate phosphatase [Arsukibacterium sp.]|uniref:undecaprenyl-diphosphate phosphatase n=1 Tax=Arsukibacterium sp. TaxID=1977258 RepID=UPI00299E9ABD|nr:undecaprenyl-diphosphate phosphatase [Arsukibacterium sp.]MDX1677557.1 undecaprenyl-diphosphate phosphatase [Arsukibacterium sp.]